MTPSEHYQQQLASGRVRPDAAQARAVEATGQLYEELLARAPARGWRRWFGRRAP
ncbi:MAG TPA: cell division protein ZapE, partial [Gammaproteobacteria bacterium]|nr:cell division protein ZapE [Gammaproteobacteria bacterium]